MRLEFHCSACGADLESTGIALGSTIKCPECQADVTVPRSGFGADTLIAGFEIIRTLGKGGMGEVYLAKQLSMGREVALKVLSAEFAAHKNAVARFLQEVAIAAKLEHANIVTAYDAGTDEGIYFMAMAYIRGTSLAARITEHGPLAEREALLLIRKLAGALNYAWQQYKLIHRDIKPANILLDLNGEPKLTDMGLSTCLEQAEELTLSGAIMGTLNYMSPEQTEESKSLDFHSDMYSLGATLYHTLTGRKPFAGNSVLDVLRKQAIEELPDPRDFVPNLSEHCVSLLQIMLAKKPAERHADWATLIEDLDFVLAAKPPSVAIPAAGQSVLVRHGQELHHPAPQHQQTPKHQPAPQNQPAPKKFFVPKAGFHPVPPPASPFATQVKSDAKRRTKLWLGVGVLGIGALGLVIAVLVMLSHKHAEAERVAQLEAAQKAAALQAQTELANKEKSQAESWQVAADFAKANPQAFDQATSNYAAAQKRLAGTKYELLAKNEIERLRLAKDEVLAKTFADLTTRAQLLADRKQYDAAAEVFAQYQGPFAVELTQSRRDQEKKYRALAIELLAQLTQAEHTQSAQHERWQGALEAVAESIAAGNLAQARQRCQTSVEDATLVGDKAVFQRAAGWLDQLPDIDKILLASFEEQKNKQLDLVLNGVKKHLRILGVRGNRIQMELPKGLGWVGGEFVLAQLSQAEQQARLTGKLDPAALGIWSGLALLKSNQLERAAEQFKATGELAPLLQAKLKGAHAEFMTRDLASLPPDEQLRRLVAELKVLNPGFDGRETHKIENAQVTELTLSADALTDLTPISGLKALRRFTCSGSGSGQRAPLANLTPLAGLPMAALTVSNTSIADLAPLKGVPLTILVCDGSPVSDLAPLSGMKLGTLSCNNTPLRDLGPLEGLSLLSLGCAGTEVEDLAALKNMPLRSLKCDPPLAVQHALFLRGLRTLTTINDTPLASFWTRMASLTQVLKADSGQPLTREKSKDHLNYDWHKDFVRWVPFDYKERPPKDEAGKEIFFRHKYERGFFQFHGSNEGSHRWASWEDSFLLEQGKRFKFTCYVRVPVPLSTKEELVFSLTTSGRDQALRLRLQNLPDKLWVKAQLVFLAETPALKKIQITVNSSKQEVQICDVRLGPALPGDETNLLLPQAPTTGATNIVTQTTSPTVSAKEQIRRFTEELKALNPDFDGDVTYDSSGVKVLKLQFSSARVVDLSPIRMFQSLEDLSCATPSRYGTVIGARSKLSDLSPLKGMPLVKLNCGFASITDLAPLKELPLRSLCVDGNLLTDLDALRGMQITSLQARNMSTLTNIAGLQGMPLTSLELDAVKVTDLSPIAECPLKSLGLRYCSFLKDLSPLKDLKLESLYLPGCKSVQSLEPLRNMSLKKLEVNGVTCDLDALHDMDVKELVCNFDPEKHIPLLRSLKSLVTINGVSVEEFSKYVEAALLAEKNGKMIKLAMEDAALSSGLKLQDKYGPVCIAYWTNTADTIIWPLKSKGKFIVMVKAAGTSNTSILLKVGDKTLPIRLSPVSGDWGIISTYFGGPLELSGGIDQTLILAREEGQTSSVNIFGLRLYPTK